VERLPNNKLTTDERQCLYTEEGAFAVLMGYLKSERGKIAPSVFNKLAYKLGYPKQNKQNLINIAKNIEKDSLLHNLFTKALNRQILLDDIPPALKDSGYLKETEVFNHVTNFLVDKETHNANLREMRKLQREGVYMEMLMKGLKDHLTEELKGMPRAKYLQTPIPAPQAGDRSLILFLTDWHIGALVYNSKTGNYNFTTLKGRIQDLIGKVQQLVKSLDIKHLYVFHLGDAIEQVSMRNVNQAFDAEMNMAEQVSKAQRLIVDTLIVLSKETHVTFGMIAGNHDRFEGNKADKIYNDNATYVILESLFLLQEEFGQLPNVTLLDNREDTYELTVKIAGKTFKLVHGDREKKKEDVKIPKHIKKDDIDFLVMGHIHTTGITQEDFFRFNVYVASTMGANTFSKELNLPTTAPSQMIMVLTEGEDMPFFIPVRLN
jgi:predicted phosphodiesterase